MRIISILLLILISAGFTGCSDTHEKIFNLSEHMNDIQKRAKDNPNDTYLVNLYAEEVVFSQQFLDPKNKNIDLLEDALQVMVQYSEQRDDVDMYTKLRMARLYFQIASYWNSKNKIVKATQNVQKGLQGFTDLYKDFSENFIVRAYRGVNLASLPKIFQQQKNIVQDYEFIINSVETLPLDAYEKGLAVSMFEVGLGYFEKSDDLYTKIQSAYTKITAELEVIKGESTEISADIKKLQDTASNGNKEDVFLYATAVVTAQQNSAKKNIRLLTDVINAVNKYLAKDSLDKDFKILQAQLYLLMYMYYDENRLPNARENMYAVIDSIVKVHKLYLNDFVAQVFTVQALFSFPLSIQEDFLMEPLDAALSSVLNMLSIQKAPREQQDAVAQILQTSKERYADDPEYLERIREAQEMQQ